MTSKQQLEITDFVNNLKEDKFYREDMKTMITSIYVTGESLSELFVAPDMQNVEFERKYLAEQAEILASCITYIRDEFNALERDIIGSYKGVSRYDIRRLMAFLMSDVDLINSDVYSKLCNKISESTEVSENDIIFRLHSFAVQYDDLFSILRDCLPNCLEINFCKLFPVGKYMRKRETTAELIKTILTKTHSFRVQKELMKKEK